MRRQLGAGLCVLGVAVAYLALVVALNPVLLAHEFAQPSDPQHGEADVCTWLDHAAGAGLHSIHVPLGLTQAAAPVSETCPTVVRSVVLRVDSVRGPPIRF